MNEHPSPSGRLPRSTSAAQPHLRTDLPTAEQTSASGSQVSDQSPDVLPPCAATTDATPTDPAVAGAAPGETASAAARPSAAAHPSAARGARLGVVAGVVALILLVALWCLDGGVSESALAWAVLLSAPLWLALPGLQKGQRRTYAWTSMAVVPYLALAVMESVANPAARLWAALGLCVAFLVFVLLIIYLRLSRPAA